MLVGVLEQGEPDKPTHGRKIALVGSSSFYRPVETLSADLARNDGVKQRF